jgi:hypothetical protein
MRLLRRCHIYTHDRRKGSDAQSVKREVKGGDRGREEEKSKTIWIVGKVWDAIPIIPKNIRGGVFGRFEMGY